MPDPTKRFSNRVENYVRYRPGYPGEVVALLEAECGLGPDAVVADVGSGTGILTELLLPRCRRVYAVEPNREMRAAAENRLRGDPRFTSVDGRAEATSLADLSVDLVTAGQAFHWFDPAASRLEFRRILGPSGFVALIWNERRTGTTPFLTAYEDLLERFATDYRQVDHRRIDREAICAFFEAGRVQSREFDHSQEFDLTGATGRLLSSSYAPEAGHPDHEPMLAELERIFRACQRSGVVRFDYRTVVYWGAFGGEHAAG